MTIFVQISFSIIWEKETLLFLSQRGGVLWMDKFRHEKIKVSSIMTSSINLLAGTYCPAGASEKGGFG
jgi:hypothetical protein